MANLNKVCLIGRLTRDPALVGQAGRVCKITVAVNNRKKDPAGQWVDDPVFVDAVAFASDRGRNLVAVLMEYTRQGAQVYVEGSLQMERWTDKQTQQKREKMSMVLRDIQLLDSKEARTPARQRQGEADIDYSDDHQDPPGRAGDDDDLPF